MTKHSLLSDHARRQLRMLGLTPIVDVKTCSKCGLSSEQLPKGPHPLLAKIIQARRLLERDRKNVMLSRQVNDLVSKMHYSSRCCQARLKTEKRDSYQPLWETWLERVQRVPDLDLIKLVTNPGRTVSAQQRQQFRNKLQAVNPKTRITQDVPLVAPEREGHGPKDPDCVRMAFLLCIDGSITKSIVNIFRAEETRIQADSSVQEAIAV